MTKREMRIVNPLGLHARPAAQLVKLASGFESEIELVKEGMPVNGKSIMGVMMLAAESGSSLTVRARGSDEVEAVAALSELIASGFGES
ncbi:MAG: HPr family phosphocarrier protein [Gemmatimonadetes bacterium]|nr:MAG: HPr family phosphocarrier protein [Gemmatimonadota bacterium]